MKIALLVSDLRRSRQWYASLGFRQVDRADDRAVVALGDAVLELRSDVAAAAGPHYFTPEIAYFPRGTGVEITIEVADPAVVWEQARAADVDVVTPLDGGRVFRVADPDGYLLELRAGTAANPANPTSPASRRQ